MASACTSWVTRASSHSSRPSLSRTIGPASERSGSRTARDLRDGWRSAGSPTSSRASRCGRRRHRSLARAEGAPRVSGGCVWEGVAQSLRGRALRLRTGATSGERGRASTFPPRSGLHPTAASPSSARCRPGASKYWTSDRKDQVALRHRPGRAVSAGCRRRGPSAEAYGDALDLDLELRKPRWTSSGGAKTTCSSTFENGTT